MAAPTLKLLLLVLATALRPAASAAPRSAYCPDGCLCVWLDLVCANAGLGAVPTGDYYDYVTTLFLGGNNISALPAGAFASFPKLTTVELDDNALTVLDLRVFVGYARLDTLRLARNEIATILPVGYNDGALETRALPNNQLGALDTLDLSFNRLRALDPRVFEAAPSLRHLFLDGNPLTLPADGPLLVHAALWELSLAGVEGASLSTLTFDELPNLDKLNLTGSAVRNLTAVFADSPSLYTVLLENNDIAELPAGVFGNTVQLDVLNLDGNPLRKVELGTLEVLRKGGTFSFADTPIACDCAYEDVWKWSQGHSVHLNATCNSAPPCSFENLTTA